jgi:hypothetical protein
MCFRSIGTVKSGTKSGTQNRLMGPKHPVIIREFWENGGEGGIRTHEGLSPLPVFKTGAFNRSATSPLVMGLAEIRLICQ